MMIQMEGALDGDVLHGCAAKTTKTWSTLCLVEIGMGMTAAGLHCQKCLFWQVLLILLGKLSVVHAGNTGTIPYSMRGRAAECYPGGKCDSSEGKGDGSRLYYVNPWTMRWSQIIWSSGMARFSAPGLTHWDISYVGGQRCEKGAIVTVKSLLMYCLRLCISCVSVMFWQCIVYISGMYHGCIMIVISMYLSCIMDVLEAAPLTSVFLHTLPITFLGPSLSGYPVLGISSLS